MAKGRRTFGFAATAALLCIAAGSAVAAPGDLDPSFGVAGKRVDAFGTYPTQVTFQVNDVTAVLGSPQAAGGSDGDFALTRTLADGNLDTSLGGTGAVFVDFGGSESAAAMWRVASGPDISKTVLAGNTDAGGSNAAAVARILGNGTLDPGFGSNGRVTVPLPAGETVTDVAVAPSGGVALAIDTPSGDGNFKVLVLTAAGAVDTAYGPNGDGTIGINFAADDSARSLAFLSDGRLAVGGEQDTAGAAQSNYALALLTAGGELDTGFDFDGTFAIDVDSGNREDAIRSIAIDSSNRVVATGTTGNSGATVRVTTTGALDPAFGSGSGLVYFVGLPDPNPFGRSADEVAIAPNGRIAVFGTAFEAANSGQVVLYGPDGETLGAGFTDPDTGEDGATAFYSTPTTAGVAFDPSSDLLLAGNGAEPAGPTGAWIQYFSVGAGGLSPKASYGGDGTAFIRPTRPAPAFATTSAAIPAGAGAPAGSYLIGGVMQTGGDTQALFVSRHLASGAPDSGFGVGGSGIAFAPVGAPGEDVFPGGIAVQPDGKVVIVGGTLDSGSGDYSAAAARFLQSGSLDGTFDGPGGTGDGRFTFDIGASPDSGLRSVATDSAGRIYAAGYTGTDSAIVSLGSTGGFDTAFGAGGVLTGVDGGSSGSAYGVTVQPDDKVVALAGPSPSDLVVSRFADDPGPGNTAFDMTFGDGDGRAPVSGVGIPNDGYDPLSIDPQGRVLIAGTSASHAAVARFTAAGVPDPGFSGDGVQSVNFGETFDEARSARGLPGGGVVLAGHSGSPGGTNFAVAQLTAAGEPESGFSGDGRLTTSFGVDSAAAGFGPVTASSATVAGSTQAARASARYELFVPSTDTGIPKIPVDPKQPAPPGCKKAKKKKKKRAGAAAKCKKKKKRKKKK